MSHFSRSNDARATTRANAATAARAVAAPVCADDDCMQCAMGLYCANAPKAVAKPRVRVCASWTAAQVECAIRIALGMPVLARAKVESAWGVARVTYACIVALCDAAAVVSQIALYKVCFSAQASDSDWSEWKAADDKCNQLRKLRMQSIRAAYAS